MWVPFAIIMEVQILDSLCWTCADGTIKLLKEPPRSASAPQDVPRPVHARNISTPGHGRPSFSGSERQPLLRRRSYDDFGDQPDEETPLLPLPGGTILGIHNLAIVMPQFIASAFSISACYIILQLI